MGIRRAHLKNCYETLRAVASPMDDGKGSTASILDNAILTIEVHSNSFMHCYFFLTIVYCVKISLFLTFFFFFSRLDVAGPKDTKGQ